MSKRELSESDRARLRGSNDSHNTEMYPDGELDALGAFMSTMPDDIFDMLVEIVTDVSNIRANGARDKLKERSVVYVTEAIGMDDEHDQYSEVEDAVENAVDEVFLKRFGDA